MIFGLPAATCPNRSSNTKYMKKNITEQYQDNQERIKEDIEEIKGIESIRPLRLEVDFDGEGPLGSYEVLDVFPNGKEQDIPAVFFAGFANQASDYLTALKTTALEGKRRAIAWEDRKGLDIGPVRYDHEAHVPRTQLSKVLGVIESLEYLGADRVDAIAHSEGAIHAIVAASLYPEKFRSITLVNPAGIVGNQGFTSLMKGVLREAFDRIRNWGKADRSIGGTKKVMNAQYAKHLLESMFNISKSQLHGMLEELRKNDEVKVAIVHTRDDRLFDFSEMEKVLKSGKSGSVEDYVDRMHVVDQGGHSNLLASVESVKKHVLGPLADLNANRQEITG